MSKEPMSKDQWARDFAKALQDQVSQYNSPSNAVSMARGAADMLERQREDDPVAEDLPEVGTRPHQTASDMHVPVWRLQEAQTQVRELQKIINIARTTLRLDHSASITIGARKFMEELDELKTSQKLKIAGLEDKLRAAEDECRQAKEHRGCTLKSWDLSVQRNLELIAERDELIKERAQLSSANGKLLEECTELIRQRDELKAKLTTVSESYETRIDAFIKNGHETLQRYENLFAEYQSVKADRDGLLNSLNKTTGALNKLSREHKDALVNHDSIKADHEVIKSDRDQLLGVLSKLREDYSNLMTRHELLRGQYHKFKNERTCVVPAAGVATEETKGEIVTVQGELIAQSFSGVQIRLPSGTCLYVAKEDLTPENNK